VHKVTHEHWSIQCVPQSVAEMPKMCSHIDLQTHAGNALHNPMIFTFDNLTSGSMLAFDLLQTIDFAVDSLSRFPIEHG